MAGRGQIGVGGGSESRWRQIGKVRADRGHSVRNGDFRGLEPAEPWSSAGPKRAGYARSVLGDHAVVHVLRPEHAAVGLERGGCDHRVVDRKTVALSERQPSVVDPHRDGLNRKQSADHGQKCVGLALGALKLPRGRLRINPRKLNTGQPANPLFAVLPLLEVDRLTTAQRMGYLAYTAQTVEFRDQIPVSMGVDIRKPPAKDEWSTYSPSGLGASPALVLKGSQMAYRIQGLCATRLKKNAGDT